MNLHLNLKRSETLWLIAALLVGLAVRLPGVWWGANFPGGWKIHHIDEYTHWVIAEHLLAPSQPPRWVPDYPTGTAVEGAAPLWIWRALSGALDNPPPAMASIVVSGRVISVLFGTATIFVVFLLGRKLFQDGRAALFAAWIMALGGLHVTQSHFFLADAPALFWWLLGSLFLLGDFEPGQRGGQLALIGAAFSFGMALGIKLLVITLPGLAIAALWRKPRLLRGLLAGGFLLLGYGLINLFSYGPADFLRAISGSGLADACQCSKLASLWMYAIEAPSLVSAPVLIIGLIGAALLAIRYARLVGQDRFWAIGVAVLLPLVLYTLSVIITLDHFLRHLIPYIPWLALSAGWLLARLTRRLAGRKSAAALVVGAVFAYLLFFVIDGERGFIAEPRNAAAEWLQQHAPAGDTYHWRMHRDLPGFRYLDDPQGGSPEWLVMEMHHANQLLSGYGWKNSYPRDYRRVFDGLSQENLDWTQALFQDRGDYTEAARFKAGYFMPEYRLVERLLGDRSRSYVTEVVVFQRRR